MVSGGDRSADDIDVAIFSEKNELLVKDVDEDANPLAMVRGAGAAWYNVLVKDARSRGMTLVSTAFLEATQ